MRRFAALLALTLACGCSTREHSNPFDPGNPNTGGRPAGFVALAGLSRVDLQWQPSSSTGLLGFRVYRLFEGDTGYVAISSLLPPSATQFSDFGVLNGVDHHYRLYFVFDRGLSSPAEDVATPGPLQPWIADAGSDALVRLSADGRHIVQRLRFAPGAGTTDVAVDPIAGVLWSCQTFAGTMAVLRPGDPAPVPIVSGLSQPTSLALDLVGHTAWITDEGAGVVDHFTPLGGVAAPAQLPFLDHPLDAAVDRSNGAIWVCERDGNRVRRFLADGTPDWAASLAAPSRVALDSVGSQGWVTSFENGLVVRFASNGAPLDTITAFEGPIGIAVDSRRGRIWVADAFGGQVVALRRDGSVEWRLAGMPEAREIAVDPATGNGWVTLPGAGSVSLVSPTGQQIRRLGGFSAPQGIALDDLLQREESPAPAMRARTAMRPLGPGSRRSPGPSGR
jgi:DNA-binding beta-propeller fold protein YncE